MAARAARVRRTTLTDLKHNLRHMGYGPAILVGKVALVVWVVYRMTWLVPWLDR